MGDKIALCSSPDVETMISDLSPCNFNHWYLLERYERKQGSKGSLKPNSLRTLRRTKWSTQPIASENSINMTLSWVWDLKASIK